MAGEGASDKILNCVVWVIIILGVCAFKFGVWFTAALFVLLLWGLALACLEEGSIGRGLANAGASFLGFYGIFRFVFRTKDPTNFGKLMLCGAILLVVVTVIIFLCKKKEEKSAKK